MTIKAKYRAIAPNPANMTIYGSFVPDGTNDPSSYTSNATGITTVTYNAATGCWRVTINIPISAVVAAGANVVDDKTQVESYEANVVGWSNANQTVDIELQYAADVNAGAYAASATADRVAYWINVNLADLPGNGT